MDPADLLSAAQAGDRKAFDDLVRRQARRLYGITRRITGDSDLAEDAVQETFIRVLEGRATLQRKGALDSWLARTAMHVAIDLLRRRGSRRRREEAHAKERQPPSMPEETLMRTEEADALGKALDALPAEMRAAVWLHVVEGEGLREVGECLGLPRSTVGRRVQLGLTRLRQALARAGVILPVGAALEALLRELPAPEPSPRLLARLEGIPLPAASAAAALLLEGEGRSQPAPPLSALPGRALRARAVVLAAAGVAIAGVALVLGFLATRGQPGGDTVTVVVPEPATNPRQKETAVESPAPVEVAVTDRRSVVEVRGRAVDAASAPVPGADVVAYVDLAQRDVHEVLDRWGFVDMVAEVLAGPEPLARTRAEEDGRFRLEVQEPRDLVLHVFLSKDGAVSGGMAHVLTAGLRDEIEVKLGPARILGGAVHDASASPIAGALAAVIPDPSMPFDRDFTSYDLQRLLDAFLPLTAGTDGGGSFALPPLPLAEGERYRLLAVGPGRVASHVLVADENVPVEIRLPDAVEVHGRVVLSPGELPGREARIIAVGEAEGSGRAGWFATAMADAEGGFLFGVPPSSRFLAWAKVPGRPQPGKVEVEEAGKEPLVIRVGGGGAIRGRLAFARTGEPAGGVRVLARDMEGALSSAQTVTDTAGGYRLEGLPLARRYQILVVLPGYVPRDRTAALSTEEHPEVEHDIQLVPTAVVRGKVVRPDGVGVADATVEIVASVDTPEEGMALRWRREILEHGAVVTGPQGEFADTEVVPSGKVYAWAYHPDLGESFTGPLLFQGADPQTAETKIQLDGAGIEVRVHETAGGPLAGIMVEVTSSIVWDALPDGMNMGEWYQQLTTLDVSRQRREGSLIPGSRRSETGADGLCRWTDLMSDSYQLAIHRSLSNPGVPNFDQEYWLYMGTTEPLEPLRVKGIDMGLDLRRRLPGTVLVEGGSGEEGLRVQVWFRTEFAGLQKVYGYAVTHTRAGGKFLAEGMGPGPYSIWVKREGGPMLKVNDVQEGSVDLKITYAPEERKKE
jgi:RNA polymerase sigma-70 factor (ECF subfamily)